ncbi:hypothetical protein HKX48_000685 [Thoreauomyces humboldtii]|nr:hypothetical protein HKX48_000685 [Thoreauomyces humboldtii]
MESSMVPAPTPAAVLVPLVELALAADVDVPTPAALVTPVDDALAPSSSRQYPLLAWFPAPMHTHRQDDVNQAPCWHPPPDGAEQGVGAVIVVAVVDEVGMVDETADVAASVDEVEGEDETVETVDEMADVAESADDVEEADEAVDEMEDVAGSGDNVREDNEVEETVVDADTVTVAAGSMNVDVDVARSISMMGTINDPMEVDGKINDPMDEDDKSNGSMDVVVGRINDEITEDVVETVDDTAEIDDVLLPPTVSPETPALPVLEEELLRTRSKSQRPATLTRT